ncbi:MAG: hypothetical protein HKN14_00470 [Marinicaulis sp.]|nr:SRPBCC family protein [Marinicaulis sp.]NNE39371.1 hypothetical protein [Marinicaulis sp.]NNL88621.1 hypothetical protein [Marinicaulis sp.]
MPVQTSATIEAAANIRDVFDGASSIEPNILIRPYGVLPGIAATDNDAPWTAVGQVRNHTLTDKSAVREELVSFADGENFGYEIGGFSGLFGALAAGARGDWHFTSLSAERTRIDWTYQFFPRSVLAEPFLWFIVKLAWPGYLKAALTRVKEKAEHENRDL